MALVGKQFPNITVDAISEMGDNLRINILEEATENNKKVLLFWYPKDFTFVCPTELHAFQEALGEFEKRNTMVIGASVDTNEVHFALIIAQSKEKVLELVEIFEKLNKYNNLRIYHTYDQTDIDNDKNLISVGIDVLIGTPKKLTDLFSGAGFDINRLKMFIIDDLDIILKNRNEQLITRLSEAIEKTQRIFTVSEITEKVEILSEKLMPNPTYIEMDSEDGYEVMEL